MLQSVLESDSMFGVIKWNPTTKSMANVGCCAQIIKHQTAEDGRSNIITLGQQRFQVLEIIRSTPYCSAMVSWISDDCVDNIQILDDLTDSATTVDTAFTAASENYLMSSWAAGYRQLVGVADLVFSSFSLNIDNDAFVIGQQ